MKYCDYGPQSVSMLALPGEPVHLSLIVYLSTFKKLHWGEHLMSTGILAHQSYN